MSAVAALLDEAGAKRGKNVLPSVRLPSDGRTTKDSIDGKLLRSIFFPSALRQCKLESIIIVCCVALIRPSSSIQQQILLINCSHMLGMECEVAMRLNALSIERNFPRRISSCLATRQPEQLTTSSKKNVWLNYVHSRALSRSIGDKGQESK